MLIAVFGGGVVGGGVVEILSRQYPEISIKYLVVREVERQRDFEVPNSCTVTGDVESVLADSSVDVIVELMGGTDLAWSVIRRALERGTHVVTANKALISKHMDAIEKILSSHANGPFFLYEAAVCGGIPVINTLLRGMHGDEIRSISGVMNGSTNWMLDQMQLRGVGYPELVQEAKKLGYLEADPSADVLGLDARSKLCILARIAFGRSLKEQDVVCNGIDRVSPQDIGFAKTHGFSIRLVARSWVEANTIHAVVMPAMVPLNHALAHLAGATNCVVYQAKHSLDHVMIGSGAGRYPTANSVVSDVLAIRNLLDMGARKSIGAFGASKSEMMAFDSDFSAQFYIRSASGDSLFRSLQDSGITVESHVGDVILTGKCSYKTLMGVVPQENVGIVMSVL
jgi:homoserine dehydrogenase